MFYGAKKMKEKYIEVSTKLKSTLKIIIIKNKGKIGTKERAK